MGNSFSSSFSMKPQSTVAPISVRTSDKTIRSFSTSGVYEYFIPKGVGSFVAMHRDNVTLNSYGSGVQPPRRSIEFPEDYDTPPTGELDPEFASPVGDVLLLVRLIGYETYISEKIFLKSGQTFNVGEIKMQPLAIGLQEVTVVGEKNQIIYKLDRQSISGSASVVASSGTAVDILANTPSVSELINWNFNDELPQLITKTFMIIPPLIQLFCLCLCLHCCNRYNTFDISRTTTT